MRGTQSELQGFEDQVLERVTQRGKFLTLGYGTHQIVINAMLTGRLGLAAPGSKPFSATAVVLTFGPRVAAPARESLAPWTLGADWLPGDAETVELRYRDPKRMGKVYVLPDGVQREVAGWSRQGPDADDPALDVATWQARLRRHHGELANLLKNQELVAGIGNAYSDEILWAAHLGPFRKRLTLADEEGERLWRAMRETLAWATDEVRRRVPPRIRGPGARLPQRPPQRWSAMSAVRDDPEPGGAGRNSVTSWCRSCQP